MDRDSLKKTKKHNFGTSQVVQWSRLLACTAGGHREQASLSPVSTSYCDPFEDTSHQLKKARNWRF